MECMKYFVVSANTGGEGKCSEKIIPCSHEKVKNLSRQNCGLYKAYMHRL